MDAALDETPLAGFGYASRITPGYAHATWEAMVAAVESLEHPAPLRQSILAAESAENLPEADRARRAGER